MEAFINKNDKQQYFNQIKGRIVELNDGEKFCSLTLDVGHENPRLVNVSVRKVQFDTICKKIKIEDRAIILFYLVSRQKNNRWYTSAQMLNIELL